MKVFLKYPLMVMFGLMSAPCILFAQSDKKQKEKSDEGSEIVMTEAELESFLTTIAERRKAQLSAQKNDFRIDPMMALLLSKNQSTGADLYYRELQLLHDKVDFLLAKQGYNPVVSTGNANNLSEIEKQLALLQNQNSRMTDPVMEQKIKLLQAEIEALQQQETTQSSESAGNLAGATHSLYFTNNSSRLSTSDLSALKDWVSGSSLQAGNFSGVVRLHGYASKVGNPEYNNKLSFSRANQVKEVLIEMGVRPSSIVILHHGEDPTKDDKLARRVDLVISDQ